MEHIIKIQSGCWVVGWSESSLPRTVVFQNDKVFKRLDEANKIKEKFKKLNIENLEFIEQYVFAIIRYFKECGINVLEM